MHNHITRDIKLFGNCPACDNYIQKQSLPDDYPQLAERVSLAKEIVLTRKDYEDLTFIIQWPEGSHFNELGLTATALREVIKRHKDG